MKFGVSNAEVFFCVRSKSSGTQNLLTKKFFEMHNVSDIYEHVLENFWKNNHWCLKPHWIISTLYLCTKFLVCSWYHERQSYLFFTNILRYGNHPAEYAVRASYKPKITVQGIFQKFRAMFDIGQKGDFLWKKGTKKFTPPYSIPLLHQNKALYNFCKRGQSSIVHNIEDNIGLEFVLQWLLLSWGVRILAPKFELLCIDKNSWKCKF